MELQSNVYTLPRFIDTSEV